MLPFVCTGLCNQRFIKSVVSAVLAQPCVRTHAVFTQDSVQCDEKCCRGAVTNSYSIKGKPQQCTKHAHAAATDIVPTSIPRAFRAVSLRVAACITLAAVNIERERTATKRRQNLYFLLRTETSADVNDPAFTANDKFVEISTTKIKKTKTRLVEVARNTMWKAPHICT